MAKAEETRTKLGSTSNRRHGPYQRTDELKEDVGGKDEEPDTRPQIYEQVSQ